MKRFFASLISAVMLFGITPVADAAFNDTIRTQIRGSRRDHKRISLLSYQHRGDASFRRTLYNAWASKLMSGIPAALATTGGGRTRFDSFNRPGRRQIKDWSLASH